MRYVLCNCFFRSKAEKSQGSGRKLLFPNHWHQDRDLSSTRIISFILPSPPTKPLAMPSPPPASIGGPHNAAGTTVSPALFPSENSFMEPFSNKKHATASTGFKGIRQQKKRVFSPSEEMHGEAIQDKENLDEGYEGVAHLLNTHQQNHTHTNT